MRSDRMPVWVLGVFLLCSSTGLRAQLNRGVLEGLVTDPAGAVVPGVSVTITNVDTNVAVTTVTNSSGYYRGADLVPGRFAARFAYTGFAALDVRDIEIAAGKIIRVDAQLKVGTTRQTVAVTAEVPLLETAAANASTTLETRMVDEIPVAGRDIQQLVNLVPGVNNVGGPPGSNFALNLSPALSLPESRLDDLRTISGVREAVSSAA